MILSATFFSLLGISIMLAWLGIDFYKKLGLLIFLAALILGMSIQHITPIGICIVGSLAAVIYLLRFPKLRVVYKIGLHLLLFFLFVGFSMHLIPGFHNWKLLDGIKFSAYSVPYTMYLNIEKPAYVFFFLYFNQKRPICYYNWRRILKWSLLSFVMILPLLFLCNWICELVAWDPKLPIYSITGIWIIRMLLDTTLGEELFFRGYLQQRITSLLGRSKAASWLACILVTILFGAMHLPAGISMAVMAMCAGLGYGLAYLQTKTIEAATITHFLVNLVHFLFFSYPMLGGGS
jgi:membrane protease YdiL (CAAX protease family)